MLSLLKIGSVTADSASNNLAAFKNEIQEDITYLEAMDLETQAVEIELMDEDSNEEDELTKELPLDFENTEEESTGTEKIAEALKILGSTKINRVSCNAHLIQLALKDCMTQSEEVKLLEKRLNSVVAFFRKSPFWYSKLKKKTGVGLIQPCITRWNSFFYALKRICGPDRVIFSKKLKHSRVFKSIRECLFFYYCSRSLCRN